VNELRNGVFGQLYGTQVAEKSLLSGWERKAIRTLSQKALHDIWERPKLKRSPTWKLEVEAMQALQNAKQQHDQFWKLPGIKEFIANLDRLATRLPEPEVDFNFAYRFQLSRWTCIVRRNYDPSWWRLSDVYFNFSW
jgi:hypothetical protein